MGENDFFENTHCDRCHKKLNGKRKMSMFNTDCICLSCSENERSEVGYDEAHNAEHEEIKKGNYNFKGVGRVKSEA